MVTIYTVVIADDRFYEREKLRSLIDWSLYDMQIIGEAKNGREALSICLAQSPDIVITDIRMPLMDGIELAHALGNALPGARMIFLSGYSDFTYAKSAIELNVCSYLLKPYTEGELVDALMRAVNSIAKNAKKLAREQRLLGLFADNLPVLRESFIYEVMTGGADTGNTDFWSKAAMLGLHFSYDLFFMLRIDFLPGGEGVPGARRSTIDDTLTQCVPAYCSGYHVVLQDSACYLLLNVDESLTQDKTKALLDGLCQAILGAFTCAGIRVAVRQSAQGYGHRSWNRLYTQLSQCPAAQNRPLRHDQVPEYLFTKYKQGERELFDAVAHQQMEYIHRFVDELIDQATTAALGPGALMKVCVSCYNEALKLAGNDLLLQGELDVLLDLPTLTGVSAWLRRVLGRTAQAVGQLKSKKNKGIVERVQRMIAAGFHTDIDVVSISARLNISPNYLRRIFKDYTGKSLSAYLCEYRIEKACQLLKDTDHKIADIPPMVGLENNPHFYYLIKKTTGLTPGQYRAL